LRVDEELILIVLGIFLLFTGITTTD